MSSNAASSSRSGRSSSNNASRSSSDGQSRRRGELTGVACTNCQQKKAKCGGERPSCKLCLARNVECEYYTEENETRQQAMLRKIQNLAYMVDILRRSAAPEAQRLLNHLRNPEFSSIDSVTLAGHFVARLQSSTQSAIMPVPVPETAPSPVVRVPSNVRPERLPPFRELFGPQQLNTTMLPVRSATAASYYSTNP